MEHSPSSLWILDLLDINKFIYINIRKSYRENHPQQVVQPPGPMAGVLRMGAMLWKKWGGRVSGGQCGDANGLGGQTDGGWATHLENMLLKLF